jgi:hypothetical protein
MTNPITPPPELVRQWIPAGWDCSPNTFTTLLMRIADNAALWSHDHCKSKIKAATDQELEACCEWIPKKTPWDAEQLRTARRPKPPSLKEQALEELEKVDMLWDTTEFSQETLNSLDTIRSALEALPNKPPSLKEEALKLARSAGIDGAYVTFDPKELALIRRALEAIDD